MDIQHLVWDAANIAHIARHNVTPDEVEEVCQGHYEAEQSYRGRIQVVGKTSSGRELAIVLSPQDRNLQPYGEGIYYVITAFEKGVRP